MRTPSACVAALIGVTFAASASAQVVDHPDAVHAETAPESAPSRRMFRIVPNYATVAPEDRASRMSSRQMFKATAMSSFDPYVFPFVGVVVGFGHGDGTTYAHRYGTAIADNAIRNFMRSAVLPSVLHQDPRYYELGSGGFVKRTRYALSRTVVTRSLTGHTQFNTSEIGGNLAAAAASNLYYGSAHRSANATLTRWGMQVLWDGLSNEMKEFWPDIRGAVGRVHHQ